MIAEKCRQEQIAFDVQLENIFRQLQLENRSMDSAALFKAKAEEHLFKERTRASSENYNKQ